MINKLALTRLRTLADALAKASDVAERSVEKDPGVLDPTIVDRILDIEMEVGMVLAAIEDGTFTELK
jgi:hypothetical protein